jgi:hypothetical protein
MDRFKQLARLRLNIAAVACGERVRDAVVDVVVEELLRDVVIWSPR